MARLLPCEWRKAVGLVSGEKNVRQGPTSNRTSCLPVDESALAAEYGLIRAWLTAVLVALEDPERVRGWGGRVIAVRLVLLALGQAAMVSGSSVLEFGCRNLALHAALSHRTVARVLKLLRNEPDPLVDLVSRRQAARADRYQLRIPAAYAQSARWRRRRAGRVAAIHPAFLVLGGTAGLVHQVLDGTEARGAEVARAARLSPSATSDALRVLAGHGPRPHGVGVRSGSRRRHRRAHQPRQQAGPGQAAGAQRHMSGAAALCRVWAGSARNAGWPAAGAGRRGGAPDQARSQVAGLVGGQAGPDGEAAQGPAHVGGEQPPAGPGAE